MSSAQQDWCADDIPALRVVGQDSLPAAGKARRRHFSVEYKLAIVEEYDGCVDAGEKASLLRREGLHGSTIHEWRRARDAAFERTGFARGAAVDGTAPTPAARARTSHEALALTLAIRRIQELEAELAQARLLIDIQGKARALLEMIAESKHLA